MSLFYVFVFLVVFDGKKANTLGQKVKEKPQPARQNGQITKFVKVRGIWVLIFIYGRHRPQMLALKAVRQQLKDMQTI